MSLFSGVEQAQVNGGGIYPQVGEYDIVIKTCSTRTSQQGKGQFTLVEYVVSEVLKSFAGNDEFEASNTEGQAVGWTNWQSKQPFLSNVKAFVSAVLDKDVDSVTEADCADVFESDPQEYAGEVLRLSVLPTHTKAGKPFAKVLWSRP